MVVAQVCHGSAKVLVQMRDGFRRAVGRGRECSVLCDSATPARLLPLYIGHGAAKSFCCGGQEFSCGARWCNGDTDGCVSRTQMFPIADPVLFGQ